MPARAARRTTSAECVLVTASRETSLGSRRARSAARATRERTASRRAAISCVERPVTVAWLLRSLASAPRLAMRSAFLFCSRGTCRIEKRRKLLARRTASETIGIRCGALTLKFPLTCCTSRRLSDRISTVSTPSSFARRRARRRARYSATLLVVVPRDSNSSSAGRSPSASMKTPAPAGPGLPRAAPSMWARNLMAETETGNGKREGRPARRGARSLGRFPFSVFRFPSHGLWGSK